MRSCVSGLWGSLLFHHTMFHSQLKKKMNPASMWCVMHRTFSFPNARSVRQTYLHIINSARYCSCKCCSPVNWIRELSRFTSVAMLSVALRVCCILYSFFFLTVLSSVVAMTKKNANAALVYSFLYKIVQVGLFPETLVQILLHVLSTHPARSNSC